MSNRLQLSLILLNRFVDWFIPAEIAADRESRKQARMFLISHLFGPFIGNVVPGALYLFDPTPGFDVAVLAASITAFWVFPFILRAGARYNILVLLSVQNLIFCILWSCLFLRRRELTHPPLGAHHPSARLLLSRPVVLAAPCGPRPFRRQTWRRSAPCISSATPSRRTTWPPPRFRVSASSRRWPRPCT